MITSKQVQDACRGPITYSKSKILRVFIRFKTRAGNANGFKPNKTHTACLLN